VKSFVNLYPDARFRIISSSIGIQRYKDTINNIHKDKIKYLARDTSEIHKETKIAEKLYLKILGKKTLFFYNVEANLMKDSDIVWLPWLHSHRVLLSPEINPKKIFVTYHDNIIFKNKSLFSKKSIKKEFENVKRILNSEINFITTSKCTINELCELFREKTKRFILIPVGWGVNNLKASTLKNQKIENIIKENYFFVPSNIFNHKNHEILFKVFSKKEIKRKYKLVLSGAGTEIVPLTTRRRLWLYILLNFYGLKLNKNIFGFGYISENEYLSLLRNANAVIIPSKAEGGGSFPVFEALSEGIPVIASNICPIKEQISIAKAKIDFFDPYSSESLFKTILKYDLMQKNFDQSGKNFKGRSWKDVATELMRRFKDI